MVVESSPRLEATSNDVSCVPSDRKRRTNGWTSQAAGVYPGLDRFGRVISQSWLDGVTGSTAAGYRPAIVDQIHTYDLASNRPPCQ